MNRNYFAKSETRESLREHTNRLLDNLKLLKESYGDEVLKANNIDKDRLFYLLEIICMYHDIGKVYTPFQNIILNKLGMEELPTPFNYNSIKHEQLSPMFVPIQKLGLSAEEIILVYQAIYYHHERENKEINNEFISDVINIDIKPQLEDIKNHIKIEINEDLSPIYIRYVRKRIKEGDKLYYEYCLLKGLLHRLDYSSSALMKVEEQTPEKISDYSEKTIVTKGFKLNDLQKFSKENQDANIVVIGSTGIGKTEGALIWSNFQKTFFTLPIRISINAIFDRINEDIKYKHVGLLHSSALDYLGTKDEFEDEKLVYEQSTNLYYKITTCTIDQIFPFVFKYKGYERMYATLAYSKVVIDEIQGYSPEIVAVILKGLEMIHAIGGKFMVMTATLPRIYKEQLEKMGIDFKYNEFIKNTKRHLIKLEDKEVIEDLDIIKAKAEKGKVLIIVNTVDKAIEVYNNLSESFKKVNLLHSRFILKDRSDKEQKMKEFSKSKNENGIWITTQIVEASLDIDFDYLFTEMSTLDSLFQRMGRCYRSREYKAQEPNVHIYINNVSGVGKKSVYHPRIHENSIKLLKEFDEKVIEEKQKVELVDKLYSKEMLEGTEFLKDFESGMEVLNNIVDYDINKKEAQKLLRNIESVTVIPKSIYEENEKLFEEYEKCNEREIKVEIKRKINNLTTSISLFQSYKLNNYLFKNPYLNKEQIQIIDMKYDNKIGLLLSEDEEDNWDKRSF